MTHRNDEKHRALGGSGHITDLEFADLRGAGYQGTISDMRLAKRRAELTDDDIVVNDGDFRQLGILGFLGALADRWLAFWRAQP